VNCFQLIKTVLDEAYGDIPGATEREKDDAIKRELNRLGRQYRKLWKTGCLDYSDPTTRFAYIYRYVTAHANLVYNHVRSCDHLASLFDEPKVQVACIGGGRAASSSES